MRRQFMAILFCTLAVACDEVDSIGEPDGGPYPYLNMIQVKGYVRSDWKQTDETAERARDFAGHDRPRLGLQVDRGARVFHLPYYPLIGNAVVFGGYFGWDVFAHPVADAIAPDGSASCATMDWAFDSLQSNCNGNLLSSCVNDITAGSALDDPDGPRTGGVVNLATAKHAPIFILISHQPQRYPTIISDCFNPPTQWDLGMLPEFKLSALEAVPFYYLQPNEIVTPNEIRRGQADLRTAITTMGWPSMDHFFGRYFVILLDTGTYRDNYRARIGLDVAELDPSNPLIFTVADSPNDPDAAFFSVPASDLERIRELVAQGFIVHAHSLVPAELEAARQAGAQLLTGLELDDIAFDGPAVCNPVTATEWVGCQPTDFERPPPAGP